MCDESKGEKYYGELYQRRDSCNGRGGRRRVHPPPVLNMFGTLKILRSREELPRALDNQCVVYGYSYCGRVGKEPGSDPVSGL